MSDRKRVPNRAPGSQPEGQGFKSPILHLKPLAINRKWLFALHLLRRTNAERIGAVAPVSVITVVEESSTQVESRFAIATQRVLLFRLQIVASKETDAAEIAALICESHMP